MDKNRYTFGNALRPFYYGPAAVAPAPPLVPGTLDPANKAAGIVLSGGNLTGTVGGTHSLAYATGAGKSTGKWYWEVKQISAADSDAVQIGVAKAGATLAQVIGANNNSWGYLSDGTKQCCTFTALAYGAALAINDVVGVALDITNGKVFFSKNGVWQNSGDPVAGTGFAYNGLVGAMWPVVAGNPHSFSAVMTANFGATAFVNTPPTGYNSGWLV